VDSDDWLTLEDDFVSVNIFQVSHIAYSTHVCPGKKLDEGFFLVVVVNKAISRWSMIQMLLTADDGGLLQNPHVRIFRASKYVIEPMVAKSGKSKEVPGKFSLDGERIPYGRIEGEIVPNAARIML
jgi:diacylglycerol kinase family enzyme